MAFSADGSKLIAGFKGQIQLFDLHTPGTEPCSIISTKPPKSKAASVGSRGKSSRSKNKQYHHQQFPSQKGIISAIASDANRPGVFAAGSYCQGVSLYDYNAGSHALVAKLADCGGGGGITHLRYSPDGMRLYVGARKSTEIRAWDLRNLDAGPVERYGRQGLTNQRLGFSLSCDGEMLATGDSEGMLKIYSTKTGDILTRVRVAEEAVSSAGFHPFLPLLLTSHGHRLLRTEEEGSVDSDFEDDESEGNDQNNDINNNRDNLSGEDILSEGGLIGYEVGTNANIAERATASRPGTGLTIFKIPFSYTMPSVDVSPPMDPTTSHSMPSS